MPFIASELNELFDPLFTVDGIWTPQGGAASTIEVVFSVDFQPVDMIAGDIKTEIPVPRAFCRTSDVATARHGDTLHVHGRTFHVVGVLSDAIGITRLLLAEA